jgi:excisionase family DNA binding protein
MSTAQDSNTRNNEAHPLLLSVEQARRIAGIGESKMRELLATKEVRSIRCGRRVLVPFAELERWIERTLETHG